jgi:hypothetical protein
MYYWFLLWLSVKLASNAVVYLLVAVDRSWLRCAASSRRSPASSPCSCRCGRFDDEPANLGSRHSLLLQTDHRKKALVPGDYERVLDASIHQSPKKYTIHRMNSGS